MEAALNLRIFVLMSAAVLLGGCSMPLLPYSLETPPADPVSGVAGRDGGWARPFSGDLLRGAD